MSMFLTFLCSVYCEEKEPVFFLHFKSVVSIEVSLERTFFIRGTRTLDGHIVVLGPGSGTTRED